MPDGIGSSRHPRQIATDKIAGKYNQQNVDASP
jgi:hypothetical protein